VTFKDRHALAATRSHKSAHALLTDILVSGRQVNFPVVTEICDRVEGDTRELDVVVGLLASTLRDEKASTSQRVKSLTVTHEMLYLESACRVLHSGIRGRPCGTGAR